MGPQRGCRRAALQARSTCAGARRAAYLRSESPRCATAGPGSVRGAGALPAPRRAGSDPRPQQTSRGKLHRNVAHGKKKRVAGKRGRNLRGRAAAAAGLSRADVFTSSLTEVQASLRSSSYPALLVQGASQQTAGVALRSARQTPIF